MRTRAGFTFSVPLSGLCKSTCLGYLAEAPSFPAPVSYGASRDPARLRPPGSARVGFCLGTAPFLGSKVADRADSHPP